MSDKKIVVFTTIILTIASMGWGQQAGYPGVELVPEDAITYSPVETNAATSFVVIGSNDLGPNEFTLYCEMEKDGATAKKCEIGKGHTLEEAMTIILKSNREQRILNSPRPYKPTSKKPAVTRRKP